MAAGKKKLTHPLPSASQAGRYFPRHTAFLLNLLTSSLLCSIRETCIQTLIRWFSRTPVHHLLGCPAFLMELLFLASTSCLQITGLSCSKQNKLGFGDNITKLEACCGKKHPLRLDSPVSYRCRGDVIKGGKLFDTSPLNPKGPKLRAEHNLLPLWKL